MHGPDTTFVLALLRRTLGGSAQALGEGIASGVSESAISILEASGVEVTSGATSITINLSGDQIGGDFLIARVGTVVGGKTFIVNSPWTMGDTAPDGAAAWAWCYVDGLQTNVTFSWSGSSNANVETIEFQNVRGAGAIGAHAKASGASATLAVGPNVAIDDMSLSLAALSAQSSVGITIPAGYEFQDTFSTPQGSASMATKALGYTGNIENVSVALVVSANWEGFLIELRRARGQLLGQFDFYRGGYVWNGTPYTASQVINQPSWVHVGTTGLQIPGQAAAGAQIILAPLKSFLGTCNWTVVLEVEILTAGSGTATTHQSLLFTQENAGEAYYIQIEFFDTWDAFSNDGNSTLYAADDNNGLTTGVHLLAITRVNDKLSLSVDGNAVMVDDSAANFLPWIGFPMVNFYLGGWSTYTNAAVNIRSLSVYDPVADAALPSLSRSSPAFASSAIASAHGTGASAIVGSTGAISAAGAGAASGTGSAATTGYQGVAAFQNFIAEDGVTTYVAEDGTTNYVTE